MRYQDEIARMMLEQYGYGARYGHRGPGLDPPYSRTYLAPQGYRVAGGYGTSLTGSYCRFLAPLNAGMISEIDFSRPYLNKGLDPVTGMFSQKAFFDKARIEDLLTDMCLRYDLMTRHIATLDDQVCGVNSEIMQLPDIQIGLWKDVDKVRTALEARAMDLEQEKMREEVTAWKDIIGLKTDLDETLRNYSTAGASSAFLTMGQGGNNQY